jgi:hypothetical protein
MKRALVLLIAVAALITGCGSSSSSGSSSGGSSSGGSSSGGTNSAAGILAAASASTKNATSAAFDAKLGVTVGGNLQGAGAGAALLKGPLTFEFKGHAGTAGAGKSKFDVNFALNYTGGSFSGQALSPDGKTLYLQMPALMGPGWKSLSLAGLKQAGTSGSSGSTASGGLDALKAAGLDPSKLLKNLTLSTSGGQDTISADVDLAAVVAAVEKAGKGATGLTAKNAAQIAQLEKAITKAHGSLSFDSSTHLPTDEQLQFAMTVPPSLSSTASGLKSIALNLDIKFSDWNNDFTVTAPKGAKPLNTGGLLGLGAAPAA